MICVAPSSILLSPCTVKTSFHATALAKLSVCNKKNCLLSCIILCDSHSLMNRCETIVCGAKPAQSSHWCTTAIVCWQQIQIQRGRWTRTIIRQAIADINWFTSLNKSNLTWLLYIQLTGSVAQTHSHCQNCRWGWQTCSNIHEISRCPFISLSLLVSSTCASCYWTSF